MNVWWVNQGSTYEASIRGRYLWAPLRTDKGEERTYWSTVAEIRRGDLIVHCRKGKVLALSRAVTDAYRSERPQEVQSAAWTNDLGTRVDIETFTINPEITVSSVAGKIQELRLYQGPLNKNGKPKQSYLHRFNLEGLSILRKESPTKWPKWAQI